MNQNRRHFIQAAGLAMAVPATRALAQTSRASTSINSAPKLTKVTPYVIRTPPPQWGGGTWFFVKLETDTGLVGWGATAVLYREGSKVGENFRKTLVNRDVID